MTETTSKNILNQWLFNPFRFIAGYKALLLGLAIILISTLVGSRNNVHFDGVLDVHLGLESPMWFYFAEGIINWMALAIPLFFFGLIVSPSSFRLIDVFGTQALARWPSLITALVMLPGANQRFGEYLMHKFTQTTPAVTVNPADAIVFVLAVIVAVVMVIWMVALMYRAYAVSCNIKSAKAIITFIASLIGAEVLSKFASLKILLAKI